PTVLEASRVLSAKLLGENSNSVEKLEKAFRLITSRKADEKEINILEQYFIEQLQQHQKNPGTAEKLLTVGEFPIDENLDKSKLTAMMQVIQLIYNLEESLMKS